MCDLCLAGTFQEVEGQTACNVCTDGYCPIGSANPISCEIGAGLDHTQVDRLGATGPESCVCKPGYYALAPSTTESNEGVTCRVCPSGTDCTAAGTTLQTLPIARGFYRTSADSVDLRRCPGAHSTQCTVP